MKRTAAFGVVLCLAFLIGFGLPAVAQSSIYVSPNVPTDPDGPTTYLPWNVIEHVLGAPSYGTALTIPGDPSVDGLHKMDLADNWLFSVESPDGLGGALLALPEDVVRSNAGTMTLFFDGSCVSPPIPAGSNVTALVLMPDDDGNLLVSFDVPTDTPGGLTLPSGWAEYQRTGAGACDWTFTGSFDTKSVSTTHVPAGARITGLGAVDDDNMLVAFDAPVDLAPTTGPTTYLPGQIAQLDLGTGSWSLFEDMLPLGSPGWPVSSQVDALTCEANPGRFDALGGSQITLDRVGLDVTIICPGSCSSGAQRSGIYEGSLTNLRATGTYDHTQVECAASCPGLNMVAPATGDRYFLVVPNNGKAEGSYGLDSIGGANNERPRPLAAPDRCVELQKITACP